MTLLEVQAVLVLQDYNYSKSYLKGYRVYSLYPFIFILPKKIFYIPIVLVKSTYLHYCESVIYSFFERMTVIYLNVKGCLY